MRSRAMLSRGGIDRVGVDGRHLVVFANEKGGTGKSITCVHVAVGLTKAGWRVGLADLDNRQRTADRYVENRRETARRCDVALPSPEVRVLPDGGEASLDDLLSDLAANSDVVLVDTPGRDDPFARAVAGRADTLVTPMNDSFVDLDLIGTLDADGGTVDWVVLRNRLQQLEARNMKRVAAAMVELSKRVGVRVVAAHQELRELLAGLKLPVRQDGVRA